MRLSIVIGWSKERRKCNNTGDDLTYLRSNCLMWNSCKISRVICALYLNCALMRCNNANNTMKTIIIYRVMNIESMSVWSKHTSFIIRYIIAILSLNFRDQTEGIVDWINLKYVREEFKEAVKWIEVVRALWGIVDSYFQLISVSLCRIMSWLRAVMEENTELWYFRCKITRERCCETWEFARIRLPSKVYDAQLSNLQKFDNLEI